MSSGKDMFIINKIFPNAKDIFTVSGRPISEIKNDCLFVFDTNSLILPYTTSSESLDEIKKVYTKIIDEKRFFIPGQVAREFARIRPEKIKEVFQQLTKSRNSIPVLGIGKYPLLEGIKDYDELSTKEKEINSLVKDYAKQLGKVIEHVKEWSWNDPVSQLYKSLFNDGVIYDIELDEEKIKKELEYRYENKIPPGYEDRNKDDGGTGDLLIWFTILELAETHKKDIVFISGDEKKDWFYQVDKQSLYPKFELTAEFRGKAPDKTFSIIKLSELLELFGADERVIKELEIEEKEKIILDESPISEDIPATIAISVLDWLQRTMNFKTIEYQDKGLMKFVLGGNDNKTLTAVDVIYSRRMSGSPLYSRISKIINDFNLLSEKKLVHKFILFIVVPYQLLITDDVFESIRRFIDSSDSRVELIMGCVDRDDVFVRLF